MKVPNLPEPQEFFDKCEANAIATSEFLLQVGGMGPLPEGSLEYTMLRAGIAAGIVAATEGYDKIIKEMLSE